MTNRRLIIIAAVLVLLGATIASAQPGQRMQQLVTYLQLTPDQVTAWKNIHDETSAQVKPLAENARSLATQLKAAVNAATPDAAAVGKLTLDLHAVREQIRAIRQEARAKRLAVLTDEQKTKLTALETLIKMRRHR